MTTTLRLSGTEITFPPLCMVCATSAKHDYPIERTFFIGRRPLLIHLPMPLCEEHYAQASVKNRGERWGEWSGVITGGAIGLVVSGSLLAYWSSSGQGGGVFNWLLAVFVGFSLGLIVYLIAHFWLAPWLAAPETKVVRQSVRLIKYWPQQDVLELAFINDEIARQVVQANKDKAVE